jgi:hypothetical protein
VSKGIAWITQPWLTPKKNWSNDKTELTESKLDDSHPSTSESFPTSPTNAVAQRAAGLYDGKTKRSAHWFAPVLVQPPGCYYGVTPITAPMMEPKMSNSFKLLVSVRSLDPAVPSAKLAGQIEQMQSGLLSEIQELGAERAVISRARTFPVTGSEIAVEILIGVATGVGEAIGSRIGDRVLDWLRRQWPNADTELIELHLSDSSERTDREA